MSRSEPRAKPLSRAEIKAGQLAKLRRLLAEILPRNRFWATRLAGRGFDSAAGDFSLEDFIAQCPTVTKAELTADQERHPPHGSVLTYPPERYVRFHQTSGTSSGRPLVWLDTASSWRAMLGVWRRVFTVAGIAPGERFFFPFSFGPFLGFWAAFDAAKEHGCLVIPGGGMSSRARLGLLGSGNHGVTAMCATPTYSIRLAEVAQEEGIDLGRAPLRTIVVAGEPGGSVPGVRERITELWPGARVFDHHGMTEVGPVSFPNARFPGVLHVDEGAFLAEIVDLETGAPAAPGETGELILTTLERLGSPLLRYRTGDLVRRSARSPEELGHAELALEGGILARTDDMVTVRGVNLFPSAVEEVIRQRAGVAEFRVELDTRGALAELRVEIEPAAGVDGAALAHGVADDLRLAFQLRVPVTATPPGSLPRFELKARRWIRKA